MSDAYELSRFVDAQEGVVAAVERELEAGKKRSHWMWFAFPQIEGLGSSPTAQRYAIRSLDEAIAYLEHPILGERLTRWTESVLQHETRSAEEIFGYPDYLKFRSSMTLFDVAERRRAERTADRSPGETIFGKALDMFYRGNADEKTLRRIGA